MALRAVRVDEKAPPKTITEAARNGSQRELLVALRDRVAVTLEDPKCPARDITALSKRLWDLTKEIEILDHATEGRRAGEVADEAFDAAAL